MCGYDDENEKHKPFTYSLREPRQKTTEFKGSYLTKN